MLGSAERYIRRYGMLPTGCRALAGVSGGMDSTALLHILCALREKLGIELQAAHFNHGIRAESEEEERFVREMCQKLGVKLSIGRADVPELARKQGVSLEVAAREARHAFFREVMAREDLNRLALAHHRGDQAETLLLRLARGAGTMGLGAMAPMEASGIIRPLLWAGRADIRGYCEANNLMWREDASNLDTAIPRNFVRHEILPGFARLNPSAEQALCRAAELLREDEEYLSGEAAQALARVGVRGDGSISVPAEDLSALHPAVLNRALRILLARAGLTKDVEAVNIADVRRLLAGGMTGKRVDLDGGRSAVREAAALVIYPSLPEPKACEPVPLKIPGRTETALGAFVCELQEGIPADYRNPPEFVRYMDLDVLPKDIVARGRLPGDRFRPLGAPGERKLKEYFIDAKTARHKRDFLPLIAAGGDVLWPVGFTIADTVKITERTRTVLKITYTAGEETV